MKWSNEMIQYLLDNVKGTHTVELTRMINERFNTDLSVSAVKSKMRCLHVGNGISVKFQKGQTSPRKGCHMSAQQYEKCRAHMFKQGNVPPNTRPIGSERIIKDNYIQIKVSDNPSVWMFKQRYVWEQYHGKLDDDHIIVFKDNNPLNCDIDNLCAITRADMVIMNQNGWFSEDPQLTQAGITVSQIMNRKRELNESHKC